MKCVSYRFAALAFLAVFAAGAAPSAAQPTRGDLVIGRYGGGTAAVLYAGPGLGTAATLHTWGASTLDAIQVDYGNGAVLASRRPQSIVRITPAGAGTTIHTLPASDAGPTRMALAEDGHFLVTRWTRTPNVASILKVEANGPSVTTLTTVARTLFDGVCRNQETGQIAVLTDRNQLLELDPATGAYSTMAVLPGSFGDHADFCYLPDRNLFAVAESGNAGPAGLLFVTPKGSIVSRTPLGTANGNPFCLTYDDRAGRIYCGTGTGVVIALTSAGVIVSSRSYGTGTIYGLDVWDDRNITLDTTGRPGTRLAIEVSFRRSAGRPYCLAVSGSLRPGLVLGGQRLNAAPDTLFFATACRLPGFAGVLSAAGEAKVVLGVPALPTGLRLYITGVAVNPTLPGGFDVGNSECLRIR